MIDDNQQCCTWQRLAAGLLLGLPGLLACGWSGAPSGGAPDGGPEPLAVPGAELTGRNRQYDWHGYSLSFAGDVNGDGHGDLLVSALSAGEGGRVSLYFGPISQNEGADQADVRFTGESGFSNLGESMARAGGCDVNGDMHADVLVGAPFADVATIAPSPATSGDNRGKAYLFFGAADMPAMRSARDADVQFLGEDDHDAAGSSTTCLGDLDGDGYDDIAISARRNSRGATRAGSVYLFYGRPDMPARVSLGDADAIFTGEAEHDGAGVAVSRAGDVDGDGLGDLLIGAPQSDAGGEESGAAYIVTSQSEHFAGAISLASAVRVTARLPGLRLGWSVDRAGDVDGDGLDDVILGTYPLPDLSTSTGGAWLLRGTRGLVGSIDLTDSPASQTTYLAGERTSDAAGVAVAGIGDVNGDGLSDVLVGAALALGDAASQIPGNSQGAGRAYLVLGQRDLGASLALAEAGWIGAGAAASAYYGEAITGLGDMDGDGYADFAVSARGTRVQAVHSGVVRIYRGSAADRK